MECRTFYNLKITSSDLSKLSKEKTSEIIKEITNAARTWDDDVDEDMKEYSKKYPDLVFELAWTGEEKTDLGSTYYKDGKMQHCPVEFVYPPYDESKLI